MALHKRSEMNGQCCVREYTDRLGRSDMKGLCWGLAMFLITLEMPKRIMHDSSI